MGHLSLYSTAMRNYWRWGLALGQPPNAKIRVGNTNMLVSKNAKICITPNAEPQHESVEYRWRWLPNTKFSRWPCRFHVFYPVFFVPNAKKKCSQWNMGFIVYSHCTLFSLIFWALREELWEDVKITSLFPITFHKDQKNQLRRPILQLVTI